MTDLTTAIRQTLQALRNLPGAPSTPELGKLTQQQFVLVCADLTPQVNPREIVGFAAHWMKQGDGFFPKAKDLFAFIASEREQWPTVSVPVGTDGLVTITAVRRCPPWEVATVAAEMEALRMPELPAPEQTERKPFAEAIAEVRDRIAREREW